MKMAISVPTELWNTARMIMQKESPSAIVQTALRFYVNQNMTDDVKRQMVNNYAKSLGLEL